MKRALIVLFLLSAFEGSPAHAQVDTRIYKLAELRWPQIDALDRDRTMFVLPIGMLEEHGPHLPIGSDTFGVAFEAEHVVRRVAAALPEWSVVVMPMIEYGTAGANVIGGQLVHPGTYGIRQATVRALVADIGAQVALNRFKWIFVLTGHGGPPHGIAVNEACDFVTESYGVTMLHVSGVFRADETIQANGRAVDEKHFSPEELSSFGLDVHAGVRETSANLALRPELVASSYKELPAQVGHTREELQRVAKTPGWQGYLSAPARATAAYGHAVEAWWVEGLSDVILRAVRGENLLKAPRAPDRIDPALTSLLDTLRKDEKAFEARFQEWLARRSKLEQ
jgi:creatinine amidohydrolase